jgi:hypothetical protein
MATKNNPMTARDGAHQSPWQSGLTSLKSKGVVNSETVYDVLVIGGGITGLKSSSYG